MSPSRKTSQVSTRTIWTIALNLLLIAAVIAVLRETYLIVSWILTALFVALALDPVVGFLERKVFKGRRGWAVLAVFLTLAGLAAVMALTFIPLLVQQGQHLVQAAPDLLEQLRANRTVQWADQRFDVLERAQRELRQNAPMVAMPLLGVVGGIFKALAAVATVVALTIFMLLFGGRFLMGALEWVEPAQRERYLVLARRMHSKVGGYVAGTLLVGVIAGVLTTVGTLILGVPYFLPLGLIMVVLSVIPFVGSALGALLVSGTTAATVGVKQGLIVLGAYLVYQQVENHVLQPVVQRRTIRMNPLLITIVMLFGTALAGVLGTLLALPVAGALQVVLLDVLERRKARYAQSPRQLTFSDLLHHGSPDGPREADGAPRESNEASRDSDPPREPLH